MIKDILGLILGLVAIFLLPFWIKLLGYVLIYLAQALVWWFQLFGF